MPGNWLERGTGWKGASHESMPGNWLERSSTSNSVSSMPVSRIKRGGPLQYLRGQLLISVHRVRVTGRVASGRLDHRQEVGVDLLERDPARVLVLDVLTYCLAERLKCLESAICRSSQRCRELVGQW